MTTAAATAPSAGLPASSWSAKLAALVGRGAPAHDPRVVQARQALAYHRLARVVAAERELLNPADARLLADLLTGD